MARLLFLLGIFLAWGIPATPLKGADGSFQIDYNSSQWEPKETLQESPPRPGKTLLSLERKTPDDRYHARFSVVTDPIKKAKPEQYFAKALKFMKDKRFRILSQNMETLPFVRGPVYRIVANQRDFGLTFEQRIFIHQGKAFLLTAATRMNKFKEYLPETAALFQSFRLTNE